MCRVLNFAGRLWTVVAGFLLTSLPSVGAEPLKVFILAGQSNMEGHARLETFPYIGDDPLTAPLLAKMQTEDGRPRVCDGVWITYLTGSGENIGEAYGKLTTGYGARRDPQQANGKIGPEFTFGLTMDEAFEEPVLIIKTAWGGKSLYYDFRPPSAGVYERSQQEVERERNPPEDSGRYYRLMLEHVQRVLSEPGRVCPAYDPEAGFEIAGFVWFQGWNDMVNRTVYPIPPPDSDALCYADYSRWLADFIRDVRRDLNVPNLPFVIGVMGVGGQSPNEHVLAFRDAMRAPAELKEFRGTVAAVEVAEFWDEPLAMIDEKIAQVRQMAQLLRTKNKNSANKNGNMSPEEQQAFLRKFEAELISPEEAALRERGASNAGYHYLGCAKTFALLGEAFAHETLKLNGRSPKL